MGRKQVPCPHCHVTVLPEYLDAHITRLHVHGPLPLTHVECPHCKRKFRQNHYQRHLRDKHSPSTSREYPIVDNLYLLTSQSVPEQIAKTEHEQMLKENRRTIPIEAIPGYDGITILDTDWFISRP